MNTGYNVYFESYVT